MSGSTTNLDLISASQASKEVTANDLFDAGSPATLYGRRATTTAALTWGYYGGTRVINGVATTIANGTVALSASLTNYVEANRATGAVTANTTAFTAGADPLYTIVAGTATVTSYTDNRTSLIPVGFLSKSVAAGGTITLTNAESNNHLFEFTGVLPNNTTVVFPATPARLQCENLTTGAFTLTIKTAAGTGIIIPQNTTQNLYCNGVNIEDSNSGKEDKANKDVSGGYVGKTLEKINFWNAARTFMSFLTNAATAVRTYTFPDRDGTIALKDDAGIWSGTTGGSTTAYTLTPSPAIAAYADGQRFLFIAHATNTIAGATFAVSGLPALPSTMGSVSMPIGGLLINNKYWGLIESGGTAIRIAPYDAVSVNGDTLNGSLNMVAGSAYMYDGANVVTAQVALNNYFLGNAGNLTMTGDRNTAVGPFALVSNTTGYYNTATGYGSLLLNTTGANNTAYGLFSSRGNTTGITNAAFGTQALYSGTTGNQNTAVGVNASYSNVTGGNNTSIGTYSLYNNTGGNNTGIGVFSFYTSTSGVGNTGIGYNSGYGDGATVDQRSLIDNYATFIGFQASRDASVLNSVALTNITAIGKNARVGASNTVILGGTGADAVKVGVSMVAPSAILHIPAGVAAAGGAPLKFTSGTDLTTAEAGAMEYDGTNLHFSPSTVRKTIMLGASAALGTAPTIASGFGTTPTIPFNNGAISFEVNVGTGGVATSGVITMPAATNGWTCKCMNETSAATTYPDVTAMTTTSLTITNFSRTTGLATAWAASEIFTCMCIPY